MSQIGKQENERRIAEIAYIDESYDDDVFAMSALIIPTGDWREAFTKIREYRRALKDKFGIFTSKEFHATDFVAGRGRIAPNPIPKRLRALIFHHYVKMLGGLPNVAVISGAWTRIGLSRRDVHAKAFSRIQERLQTRCERQKGEIISIVDDGRAAELEKVARRATVWNPIPSRFGAWGDGAATKNIPNDRLIEDPIFKPSHRSYFLQSADFIAFALLKSEVTPTAHVTKYQLDKAYELLRPVCVVKASPRDPKGLGIVRT